MKKFLSIFIVVILLFSIIQPVMADGDDTISFPDTKGMWFAEAVNYLVTNNAIGGWDGLFHPQESVTVEMFIKVIVDMLDFDPTEQEKNISSYWSDSWIKKAIDIGLIKKGDFNNYKRAITRQEIAIVLKTAMDLQGELPTTDNSWASKLLTDIESSPYQVYEAFAKGLITGYGDKTFRGNNTATRAEMAAMIHRLFDTNKRVPPKFEYSEKIKLKYEVTIEDLNKSIVKVKMNISNITDNKLNIEEAWGNGLGYTSHINEINVYGDNGKKLTYTTNVYDFGNENRKRVWEIDVKTNKEITIEYRRENNVIIDRDGYKEAWGYVGEGFAFISGSTIFLTPSNNKIVDPNIEVIFNVPDGANILVPWEKEGNIYYPNKGRTFVSEESTAYKYDVFGANENTLSVMLDAIGIGDYRVYKNEVNGIELTIGITSAVSEQKALEIVSDIENMTKFQVELFGTSLDSKYLVLLGKKPVGADGLRGAEFNYSQSGMIREEGLSVWTYNHILFHRWNGWNNGWEYKHWPGYTYRNGENQYTNYEIGHLVEEGFNDYYISKAALKLDSELFTNEKNMLYHLIADQYNEYKNISDEDRIVYNRATNNLFSYNEMFTAYTVGSLYSLYLDYTIMDATNGEKSLDDVQRLIIERYSPYKNIMDKKGFLDILKEVSGFDFSEFYNKYIGGDEFLNMDYIFADTDSDGVPNYVELIQKTDKTDRNSYKEYTRNAMQR